MGERFDGLDVFRFGLHDIRVEVVDGEPWFLLGDVCRALNLSNPSMVAQRLQPHQRSKLSLGRQGDALVINESGLYRVVLRSDSPQAEPFQVWVTEDVLPSIRKTGSYQLTIDPLEMAERYVESEKARRILMAENASLAPQAQQFQALMATDGTYSVADAAKILRTGELRLFKLLRDRQILMSEARSGAEHHNVPYQQYIDRGYFTVITRPRNDGERLTYTTRVTPKGLAWLQRKMTEQQLLPAALPAPVGAQA